MSTVIQITPKSGITVGSTAITSGTDARILFQNGGKVSQSSMLTFTEDALAYNTYGNFANTFKRIGNNFGIYAGNGVYESILGGTSGLYLKSGYDMAYTSGNNHNFMIGTGSPVSAMYINSSLNVGVGTTSPSSRLDVKAQGALSTDVAFRVRNSADTYNVLACYGSELTIIGRNESTEPRLLINRAGSTRMLLGGTTDLNITFPSVGKGEINSGSQGLDIISSSGEIKTRNSSTYTLLSGNFFGIGRTPSARLDVQAQGALSTDIVERWRNSADTANIGKITGDGAFTFGTYTSPTTRLSVTGATGLGLYCTGQGTGAYFQNETGAGTGYAAQFLGRQYGSGSPSGYNTYGILTAADTTNGINFGIKSYASNGATNYAAYLDAYNGTVNYALFVQRGKVNLGTLPTSSAGLSSGDIWNDGGILKVA